MLTQAEGGKPGEPSLEQRALAEAEAMAGYALAQGLPVPPAAIEALVRLRSQVAVPSSAAPEKAAPQSEALAEPRGTALFTSENPVNDSSFSENPVEQLIAVHQALAELVAPATPRTLLLLSTHRQAAGRFHALGPVPLVRQMMFMALLFLVMLLGLSCFDEVKPENMLAGFFGNSGRAQLFCQGFLLCSAGLGACFAALFQVNRYVGLGVYDSKYDASYWSRLVLGLMAGILLAELVGPQVLSNGSAEASAAFAKPTLAMLGGFSASAVHRVLERLSTAVESLVAGPPAAIAGSPEATARTKPRPTSGTQPFAPQPFAPQQPAQPVQPAQPAQAVGTHSSQAGAPVTPPRRDAATSSSLPPTEADSSPHSTEADSSPHSTDVDSSPRSTDVEKPSEAPRRSA